MKRWFSDVFKIACGVCLGYILLIIAAFVFDDVFACDKSFSRLGHKRSHLNSYCWLRLLSDLNSSSEMTVSL